MEFNYSKLFVLIKEKFGTIKGFADSMDLSRVQMSYKLNNHSLWNQSDIVKAIEILNIEPSQAHEYFLTKKGGQ